MADTAAQLREVVRRLRNDGHRVEPVPGWETRGKGPMTTRGRIEHHTATPRSAAGDAPTLRIVTHGHGSLRNSLSRWYVSRTGVIYLVAAGVSWHAGRGGKGTNATLSGTEAEHSGRTAEPWSAASLAAQAAISRHEAAVLEFPTSRVWEHREHAPDRKTDRVGIVGAEWRAQLATGERLIVNQQDEDRIRAIIREEVAAAVWGYHGRAPDGGEGQDPDDAYEYLRRTRLDLDYVVPKLRRTVRAIAGKLGVTSEV